MSIINWHLQRAFSTDWTTTRSFAICLCGDWTLCCCSCWPSTPPVGSPGWRSGKTQLALWKTGRTGLQIVRYFQELILWAQFLHLLISRKVVNSFMVTSVPQDQQNLLQKHVLDHVNFPFIYITYVLVFTLRLLGSSFSELSEVLSPSLKSLFCLK